MRNKIKQLMNKEEGFTLVELLAVIVILGIIVAIAIPSIGTLIDGADQDAKDAEETLVIDAARLYEIDPNNTIGTDSAATDALTVGKLKEEGFLESRDSEMLDSSVIYRDTTNNDAITVNAQWP